MTRSERRFVRQLERMRTQIPGVKAALAPGARWRLPAAILLIIGGIFSFLPVLGLWMLPLGLILLAVDMPWLQPRVGAWVVRFRAAVRRVRRRFF